ncbi:MAG: transporter [Calditrichaeota bacterium]|nr:MAG: transporter [Calditrichota bacterium]
MKFKSFVFIVLILLPSLAFSGAWSRKPGQLGLKVSYFSLVTDKRYSTGGGFESRCLIDQSPDCFLHPLKGGEVIPVFSDLSGSSKSRAIFLSMDFGVVSNIEVSAQIGYFWSENDFDVAVPSNVPTSSNGFSDLRVNLKYQYLKLGNWAAALSGGFKAPTGEFQRNAFGVSLGEGGWDYQLTHDLGLSLWPLPAYANVMVGYRWRATNKAMVDFGDEFLYNVEAGVNFRKNLLLKVSVFGFNASDDQQFLGIGQVETPGRKINFFAPSILWTVGGMTFEGGIEHSLSGRNYIRGTKLNFGIFREFTLY